MPCAMDRSHTSIPGFEGVAYIIYAKLKGSIVSSQWTITRSPGLQVWGTESKLTFPIPDSWARCSYGFRKTGITSCVTSEFLIFYEHILRTVDTGFRAVDRQAAAL